MWSLVDVKLLIHVFVVSTLGFHTFQRFTNVIYSKRAAYLDIFKAQTYIDI